MPSLPVLEVLRGYYAYAVAIIVILLCILWFLQNKIEDSKDDLNRHGMLNEEQPYFSQAELKNALKNFKANMDDVKDKEKVSILNSDDNEVGCYQYRHKIAKLDNF